MLILLPPSETKLGGGDSTAALDLTRLSYPMLSHPRAVALAATELLSQDFEAMAAALKIGPTQTRELERNRDLPRSPVMPALLRYTGVLYDALDVRTLSPAARDAASRDVVIHSALFGLLGADDPIPAYRVSHDSRLPGVRMRALWSASISAELDRHNGLILDLRSEAYAALGPLPSDAHAYYLRVVTQGIDGHKRALNHFNKKGKGTFVRAVLEAAHDHSDVGSLLRWAEGAGVRLVHGAPGELELTVG